MKTFQKNHAAIAGFTLITRRGTSVHTAKLNEAAVREIRTGKLSRAEYARKYGVHRETVKQCQVGRNWKHVE